MKKRTNAEKIKRNKIRRDRYKKLRAKGCTPKLAYKLRDYKETKYNSIHFKERG